MRLRYFIVEQVAWGGVDQYVTVDGLFWLLELRVDLVGVRLRLEIQDACDAYLWKIVFGTYNNLIEQIFPVDDKPDIQLFVPQPVQI